MNEQRTTDFLVCGVDDSSRARHAARYAKALADRLAAGLVLVRVAPDPVVPGASHVPWAPPELRDRAAGDARRLLARIAAEAGCPEAELRVEIGDPASWLIRIAEEHEALLLVISSRGRGPLRRALLGSVSLRLCRQAPCAVLVIPPGVAVFSARGRAGHREPRSTALHAG